MANMIYSTAFLAPSGSVLFSTENTSFPAEDVQYYTYPFRPWKATASTGWVGYDLGSATAIDAVVVDDVNTAELHIEGDTSSSFNSTGGNPAYQSGAQTVSQDANDGRYKLFFALDQTYRYWRVRNAASLTSGSVFQVGSLSILSSYVTLTYNPGFPYTIEYREPTLAQGTGEPVNIGNKAVDITLSSTKYPGTAFPAELKTLFTIGYNQPLVFYKNDSDTSEVYICHLVNKAALSTTGANTTEFRAIQLREVSDIL